MRTAFFTVCALAVMAMTPLWAHEGGHGPAPKGIGNYGGTLAFVVAKGPGAKPGAPKYQAELVRSADRTVRIYLYDLGMQPLPPSQFGNSAQAVIEVKTGAQFVTTPFALTADGKALRGMAPPASRKPYSLEVTLKEGAAEWFVAFENLD